MSERRALMIAFQFPPAAGSGTQRSLKFARYLPEFGWDVEVLTARTGVHEALDQTLLKEVPESVTVHHAPCFIPGKDFGIRGWYPSFLNFPDRFGNWLPFAIRLGGQLLRKRRFDVIYATHPTRTALLIGWWLSRSSGLPLVCDLRDPWFGGTHRKYFSGLRGARFYLRWMRQLEAKIVSGATRIIVNTAQVRDDLAERFPDAQEKIAVLPNGYDESDFLGVTIRQPEQNVLTFLHCGEIYPQYRDPRPLLEAFDDLLREGTIAEHEVKVRFVGGGDWIESQEIRTWLDARPVGRIVTIEPAVSHREAVRQILGADVLLLLQMSPLANGQIPAKVFEYLRTGRPILTLAPADSATAQMAAFARSRWTLEGDDAAGLRAALREIVAEYRAGKLQRSFPAGEQFERREMTKKLSTILAGCLQASPLAVAPEKSTCGLSN